MAKAAQRSSGNGSGANGSAAQRDPKDPAGDVLEEALRRADEAWLAERENVTEGRDCQRFYAADQWDAKAKADRVAKGRPALTVNLLPRIVRQMTGDVRKNPPSLKFLPAGGPATQETAEAYNGIVRNIEQQSQAKDCYVKAVENAAQASQGFFRVVTEYSNDDGFELDIRIRPILDPFGALLDPYALLFDKSDMRYGFVFEHLSLTDFRVEFPGKNGADFPGGPDNFAWRVGDTIRIAEYWRRVPVKKTLYLLKSGAVVDDKSMIPQTDAIANQREVKTFKVEMYRMTGQDILSGPHEWAGRYVPICMVVGEEITIDGTTKRKGITHDARDPQRIYNYARSASVEAVAMQPKAPFIGTVDMFKNRPEWKTAGSENHSFLAFNPDPKYPSLKPERSQPAIASEGLDKQAMIANQDMKDVTGIQDASLGVRSNETSGVAIARRQQEGDTTTYLYPDNLGRAIGYAGKIFADLIPRIYDNERQVRILKEDGTPDMVTINGIPPQNEETGEPAHPLYDLSAGEYDVTVTIGPAFATRRAEAAANMTDLVRAVPQIAQAAGDIIVRNMDFPGADDIAKRLEDLMPKPGEQKQDPAAAAKAILDASKADLTKAQTQGQDITNAGMMLQMQATLQQIMQMIQGGQMPAGPGASPPGGPMMMQPGGSLPPGGHPPMNVGVGGPDMPQPNGELPMVDVNEGVTA